MIYCIAAIELAKPKLEATIYALMMTISNAAISISIILGTELLILFNAIGCTLPIILSTVSINDYIDNVSPSSIANISYLSMASIPDNKSVNSIQTFTSSFIDKNSSVLPNSIEYSCPFNTVNLRSINEYIASDGPYRFTNYTIFIGMYYLYIVIYIYICSIYCIMDYNKDIIKYNVFGISIYK